MELEQDEQQTSVAVLDEDVDAAQGTAEALQVFGNFNTRAFFSVDTLLAFDQRTPFNAFVLDWTVQGGVSRNPRKFRHSSSQPSDDPRARRHAAPQ